MNEQTQQLLERLAEKLGTTVEHLWDVLVKQAPINSASSIVMYLVFVAVAAWLFRFIVRKTGEGGEWSREDIAFVPWIFWGIGSFFLLFSFSYDLADIVAGFANPEYWAIKKIWGR